MPDMTMRQAAEWAGVTRGTIHKAITSGRISANKSDTGVYRINPAELERVYPRRQPAGVSGDTPENHGDTPELTVLRREVELLREGQRASEAREADLRGERDRLLGIVESTTRLLSHQQADKPKKQIHAVNNNPKKTERLLGLFKKLFSDVPK